MVRFDDSGVSPQTRAHERKVAFTTCLFFVLFILFAVSAVLLALHLRVVYPDFIGHFGKWVVEVAGIALAFLAAAAVTALVERKWFGPPAP